MLNNYPGGSMIENKPKKINEKPKNWAQPGISLSKDQFETEIREAEKGPFYTVQESMEHFELWMKSNEKR